MNPPIISPAAIRDLHQIQQWIETQSGSEIVATRFIAELIQHCRALAENPQIGHRRVEIEPGLTFRFWVHGNYQIVYQDSDPVEIIRIFHGRRDLKRLIDSHKKPKNT